MTTRPHVLVLGGGPDAERPVSIKSATAIAEGLRASDRFEVTLDIIDTLSAEQLAQRPGDLLFPYLHGPWGEGGALQDILEADGRPFVGSGSRAARWAMDKIATKACAMGMGMPTPAFHVLNTRDQTCPLSFPVVVKPVHEGSTIGLHVCNDAEAFASAIAAVRAEQARGIVRAYMVEPRIIGRELTVGVIGDEALPIIQITPAEGLYDYQAKYHRDDTRYTVAPSLPAGLTERLQADALRLHRALGCQDISRTDFMLDAAGTPWLLEINTTPGFTDHSLVPKAARHMGIEMPALCARLADLAIARRSARV